MNLRDRAAVVFLACIFLAGSASFGQEARLPDDLRQRLQLEKEDVTQGQVSQGHFKVYENRDAERGRILELEVVVLHAVGKDRKPDPVFYLAGGPGVSATASWQGFQNSWIRKERDIVFVSQRGTGGNNRLQFRASDDPNDIQQYLTPFFTIENTRRGLEALSEKADLRMYSTPIAMDDLNEVRKALGYDKINIMGGSYGTRASLVYIRRHEETVRTATLNGVAPIEFKNPLYHAQSAQECLDLIFDEVESNPEYTEAYPNLRENFAETLARFDDGPVDVTLRTSAGEEVTVKLSREAFCSSLRFQMYYLDTSRSVPYLLAKAYEGDFRPFASSSIQRNRALGNMIAMGMLLSVTAAEDVARITQDEIETYTANTFLGDERVHRQIAACKIWPKSELPDGFGQPVKSNVPTLILSGTLDPVTPPKWGDVVAENFPNSLHIVAPAAHGVGGGCIQQIQQTFLEAGSVDGIDTDCVSQMKLPPLKLPEK